MDANEVIVSQHTGSFWKSLALNALRVLRPFFKMNDQESAAWDIVIGLIEQS